MTLCAVCCSAPAAAAAEGDPGYHTAASTLVAGSALEGTIAQILEMGGGAFQRDQVVKALRAAYNNPERAVEYLYTVSRRAPGHVPAATHPPQWLPCCMVGGAFLHACIPRSLSSLREIRGPRGHGCGGVAAVCGTCSGLHGTAPAHLSKSPAVVTGGALPH